MLGVVRSLGVSFGEIRSFPLAFLGDIVIFQVMNKELKSKFYREENLSLSKVLEIVSTYHNKDAMILVSEDTVNRTWEDRGKSDKGTNRKQPWQGKCWRCAKPGHMAKDCEVSHKHTCSKCGNRGHMEVCCRTKQDKNKAREEAIEAVEGNSEENETECGR